jgi:hypothetical protein
MTPAAEGRKAMTPAAEGRKAKTPQAEDYTVMARWETEAS